MPQNDTLHAYFYDIKEYDAMTQEEKKSTRKSSLDTLIEELDEMYIKNGWKVPEWAEPAPTRHRIIVRMPRQNGSGQSEK